MREQYIVGEKNVSHPPLVELDKIILPPLNIKLGLMSSFVKSFHKDSGMPNVVEDAFPKFASGLFPSNLGDMSDEHGERFQQKIEHMQRRYQGSWDASVMGDYCWFLCRETGISSYKRLCPDVIGMYFFLLCSIKSSFTFEVNFKE